MQNSENYKEKAKQLLGDEKAIHALLVENHELVRTRTEAEAAAEVRGYKAGIEAMQRRLRSMDLSVSLDDPTSK